MTQWRRGDQSGDQLGRPKSALMDLLMGIRLESWTDLQKLGHWDHLKGTQWSSLLVVGMTQWRMGSQLGNLMGNRLETLKAALMDLLRGIRSESLLDLLREIRSESLLDLPREIRSGSLMDLQMGIRSGSLLDHP
jgi:hypothetical protein